MGILDHIALLIRTNVDDFLDRAPDPADAIDKLLFEMQISIEDANEQIATMIGLEQTLRFDFAEAEATATAWHEKAGRAVHAGKDNLALEALRRWRDSTENAQIYERQLSAQQDAIAQMRKRKSRLEGRRESLNTQRDELVARHMRTESERSSTEASQQDVSSVRSELEQLERRIREEEARTYAIGHVAAAGLDADLDDLAFSMSVDEELLKMKQRENQESLAIHLKKGQED